MSDNSRQADHDAWPTFSVPWDDTVPGPTDMSYLLEKPAGARGFIRNVGGHFVTGDGKRWRMWALNICTDMPVPPMDAAPKVARRLAKFGVSCLRLHAIDHRFPKGILMRARKGADGNRFWGEPDQDTRALDPEGLARLDYFIACCKAEGIYLDLNLNVARTFQDADGVAEAGQVRWGKGLTFFDPRLIALQKEYATQLINHVNPFTGVRYGDETAIAVIELVNENSLIEFWFRGLLGRGEPGPARGHWYNVPSTYVAQLDRLWNDWLCQRYADRAALLAAWQGDLSEGENPLQGSVRRLTKAEFAAASAQRFQDEAQFYTDLEEEFFTDMKVHLRGELQAKQLILGTSDYSHGWSALPMLQANATLDVMDGHFYWQHPRSRQPGQQWRPNDWYIPNTPMVDAPDASLVAHCSRSVVKGLPYIVSEINEPFPNDYACEFVPIAAAYGLLQDWDGIIFYDYDGSWGPPYWRDEEWRRPPHLATFELGTDPMKWTQFAAGALLFLRGDATAARQTVQRAYTHAQVLESLRQPGDAAHPCWLPYLPGRLALVHRTEIASFNAEATAPAEGEVTLPDGPIVSDTGELTWGTTPGDGYVLIDTPRQQAIIGRAGARATTNMALELQTPFAAVQLASLDGAELARSGKILFLAATRVANTGMRWQDESRQSLGEAWGRAPIRVEPIAGRLTLTGLEQVRTVCLWPLDEHGQPTKEEHVFVASDGNWALDLATLPTTPWYLIEVQR